jgi:FAD/FMN-containing dehydrogenase
MGNAQTKAELEAAAQARLAAAASAVKQQPFYAHVGELRSTFQGAIYMPDDADASAYTECRMRHWNHDQRGYPYLIIRPLNTEDVARAVKFVRAKAEGATLCVACGCHSSKSMLDNAIIIDLGSINETSFDKEAKRITVGGGAYLKAVDQTLSAHGLAVPVGTYPETGVGGLTLAGGYGWLSRMHGLSVDNLVGAEVVLADGTIVVATETNEHADLLWGLRGGGGNFGIVTKFTFQAHELPPVCIGGTIVHMVPTVASAKSVFKQFDNLIQVSPLNHIDHFLHHIHI